MNTLPIPAAASALAALCLTLLPPAAARAQQTIEQKRPAAADGEVDITNPAGATQVIGWDRPEVAVSARLGRQATGLYFVTEGARTTIKVEAAGNPLGVSSALEIRVPRGSRVRVKSFRARIAVDNLTRSLSAESFEGSIAVRRGPAEVTLKSTSGSLEVQAATTRMDLETVNGSIQVRDAGGDLSAATVNGAIQVQGSRFHRVKVSTVSGPVHFQGALGSGGRLQASSVNGPVQLSLPANTTAEFLLATTNGRLASEFGAHDDRGPGQREHAFTVGSRERKIEARSVNGSVTVSKITQ